VSRFLPLRDDAFHPLTHEDVRDMISRIKNTTGMPDPALELGPSPEQIAVDMRRHAEEDHKELDAAVREMLGVKPGAIIGPGNVHRYRELYEDELKRRKKR